ncbi:hypothetical protein MYX82_08700 [Acidobacteria bacterium AH-259-D05]|nr:hypothetical protein [Acidobacteria bacterium AH-259-D05]
MKELWNIQQLAEKWGLKPSWIYQHLQELPHFKLGNESLLVDRIITSTWRLRRACRVEVEIFKFEKEDSDPTRSLAFFGGPIEGCDLGMAFIKQGTGGDAFSKLSRYEAAIERSLYKALHELQRLQAARNGGNVPLPLAVDADVSFSTSSVS